MTGDKAILCMRTEDECREVAVDYGYAMTTGRIDWAVCAKHKEWRGIIRVDEKDMPRPEAAIYVGIRDLIRFQTDVFNWDISPGQLETIAKRVVDRITTGPLRPALETLFDLYRDQTRRGFRG